MGDIKGKISKVESGNSYTAVNKTSNASGRYQFVRSTWEGLGYDWKDRFDPQLQEEAMTKLTNINKNEFRKRFGTDPSDADSYGLHFLGVAGYSKVKKADPNTPMSQLITGKAYDYNKNVFEKNGKPITVAQFNDWLTKKMNVKPSETTQQYSNQETQPYIPLDLNLPEMTGMTFAEEEKEIEEKPQVNKREENANKLSFISDVKELQKQQQEQAYQPPQFLEQQLVEGVAYQPIQQNFQEGGYYFQKGGTWSRQQQALKAEKDAKLKKLLEQEKPVYKKKTFDEKLAEKRQEQETKVVVKDNTATRNYNDATKHSNVARNKTDKEIAEERKAIREKSDANVLNSWSLDAFKPSNYTRENFAEMAQGLESKFRVSDEPNFFDDYLNPANMIGGMASNLGQAPLQAEQTNSYMPYVTAVGTPLAVGAMAGYGTQNTGQFINNLANPLAGTGDLVNNTYSKGINYLENKGIRFSVPEEVRQGLRTNGFSFKNTELDYKKINPELEKIGTETQYENYLKNNYPDANILYSGTNNKNEIFEKGFSLDKINRYNLGFGLNTSPKRYVASSYGDDVLTILQKKDAITHDLGEFGAMNLNEAQTKQLYDKFEIKGDYNDFHQSTTNKKVSDLIDSMKMKGFSNEDIVKTFKDMNIDSTRGVVVGGGEATILTNPDKYNILGSNYDLESFKKYLADLEVSKEPPKYQLGGIKIDPQGYWNPDNEGKPVVIPSPSISMKNVDFSVLGTSLETGEQKLMQPGQNYFFSNTKNVLEQPYNKLQEGGTWVEIDRGDGKIEKINTDSDEYRQLYEENRVLGREGDTLVAPQELNDVTITAFRKTKPESLESKVQIDEKELQQRLDNPYNFNTEKDNTSTIRQEVLPEVKAGQKLPDIQSIKNLASTYKTEEELFNLKVQEEQKLLEEERSKKREDLDLPEDKLIEALNPKNEREVLEAQKFLASKGYNLNPEGKFKNQGIDGKLGKVTQSVISQYNKSLSNPTYTSYKKGEGFLGYCTEQQCSEFVQNENFKNLKPNIPRQKFNELTGLSGDAWTIGKNIEKAGGQKVPTNKVKEGDIITIFTGGSSPYLSQAKKAGTDATHTAIIDQVNPDGSYYILHNVHELDKVQSTLKGSPQWRGREYRNLVKNGQIVGDTNAGFIVRDAYRPNYKEVKNFEKKVKVRDDVGLTIKQDKLKKLETYNKSYTGVDINSNVNAYLQSLNNTETKKVIAVKHGLSESDYQSISKVALGILGQETGFGTSDYANVKRVGAEVREFFGGTEASRGDAQVKYETNYGKGDLNELGINKDNFTDRDKISLVVADIIATHYKYFIKKGEPKEKALYKAVEKYNKGRSTKNSENYDSDYVNKVLNYADYFDVVDKKGESYKTIQDDLIAEDNVVKKKIKNDF